MIYSDIIKDIKISKRHKIRLFIGIHGSSSKGYYFGNFDKVKNVKIQKLLYKFMFHIGNPFLNFVIGFKEGDWKSD